MRRLTVISALVLAIFAAGPAGAAGPPFGVQSAPYVGINGELLLCPSTAGVPVAGGVGGACFDLTSGYADLTVIVEDLVDDNSAFRVAFFANGNRVGPTGKGCGDGVFAIPAGATQVRITVSLLGLPCPNGATGGMGVAGYVKIVTI